MMGKSKASRSARELFAKSPGVNQLALARIGLFGARDVWFVVGVPVFLYASGWTFTMVGGYLAAWTIGYGLVQAVAPSIIGRSVDGLSREVPAAQSWSLALVVVPVVIALLLAFTDWRQDVIVVLGLSVFGIAFAVNSSVHSYLVLAYAGSEKAAEDVGFYYAANAAGRFGGTLLSGVVFQAGGITACLAVSAVLLAICWGAAQFLPRQV
jgi:predicted MFS family arabinose efflux permease